MLRLTPPIARVVLCEYRLDDPERPADLSFPLPPPRQRHGWSAWSGLCDRIDRSLRVGGGVLREPWLEFDHPFEHPPGVFFRLDHRQGALAESVGAARQQLMPQVEQPLCWPSSDDLDLGISHCGFFPSRTNHQHGAIRLNLTGPDQWAWLTRQAPNLCSDSLAELLQAATLCWSATFDWGANGIQRLGFELFPAGRLQRGSAIDDPVVQTLLHALKPWCSPESITECQQHHHNWRQQQSPSHQDGFSHLKLSPESDGAWSMKLYLLSHAAR